VKTASSDTNQWLTASLKFLIPFALLTALGAHISLHHVAAAPLPLVVLIDKIAEPLVTPTISEGVSPSAVGIRIDCFDCSRCDLDMWCVGSVCLLAQALASNSACASCVKTRRHPIPDPSEIIDVVARTWNRWILVAGAPRP
jgi:hypothetical protein